MSMRKSERYLKISLQSLLKQTFVPIVENLRSAAKSGDMQTVELAAKLFEKTGKTK